MKTLITTLGLLVGLITYAQTPTIGLMYHDTTAFDGYTLFTPEKNNSVYLINNCGELVNEWTFNERPGATCYLLPNGNLLRAGKDSIQIKSWSDSLVWSFATTVNGYPQHHDIEPLPNGNILLVLSDIFTPAEALAMGRDSTRIGAQFKLDRIVELQPAGMNQANLVWDWRFSDHMIQDFDSTKDNYGQVALHPELLDINYDNNQLSDYTHVNGLDYNAQLDQILISARSNSEIYIIDHSTSTLEAAGHTGGTANKGGDFLWRWGNPGVYGQDTARRRLFFQHDPKWVEAGYLDAGKISVFNNEGDSSNTFSAVHLIEPVINSGVYAMANNTFLPSTYDWTYTGTILGVLMQESKKSGCHSLPNGNFIIAENSKGRVSEVDKSGTVLWVYTNPTGSSIYPQFASISGADNSFFRAEKYPSNYAGFSMHNITFNGIIENQNAISDACKATGIEEHPFVKHIGMLNPSIGQLQFTEEKIIDRLMVYGLTGQVIFDRKNINSKAVQVNLLPGIYVVHLQEGGKIYQEKLLVQ